MMHPLDEALKAAIAGYPDKSESLLRFYHAEVPEDPRAIFNLGWHDMRHGQLAEGARKMDYGRFLNCFGSPAIPGPIWRDEPLEGKILLFRCEGGFGDEIANVRFAKDFERLGATVIVACSPALRKLFQYNGMMCINTQDIPTIHYDYWVPAMSASHVLGYEYETLSGEPYLTAVPRDIPAPIGNLKVGIRWAGNQQFEHQQHRLFDPQPLIDLHKIPNVTLFSLQRDENLIDNLPFTDLRDVMKTWTDTAEILMGLDLVITSCTSVAHCAAALGVETWIIVPVLPYYTWAVDGESSAWYNSVRLFRQQTYGDWSAPLAAVTEALREKAANALIKL